jgi:hypothetical protein
MLIINLIETPSPVPLRWHDKCIKGTHKSQAFLRSALRWNARQYTAHISQRGRFATLYIAFEMHLPDQH